MDEADGVDGVPVPRRAATIALVRDGHDGIETWMMRRVTAMAFASGALVFPGGGVDPADADSGLPWVGDTPESLANRLGLDAAASRALINAAARELFEEAGVLVARPEVEGDLTEARLALEARSRTLADLLASHHSALDVSRLLPWARWVTPPSEQRRYDTWFFVSPALPGSEALRANAEADASSWYPVREVLDMGARGEALVLPPTVVMLRGLLAAGAVGRVLEQARSRSLGAVHPEGRDNGDGTLSVLGGGEEVVVSR